MAGGRWRKMRLAPNSVPRAEFHSQSGEEEKEKEKEEEEIVVTTTTPQSCCYCASWPGLPRAYEWKEKQGGIEPGHPS